MKVLQRQLEAAKSDAARAKAAAERDADEKARRDSEVTI
jgi:hypothetical protein